MIKKIMIKNIPKISNYDKIRFLNKVKKTKSCWIFTVHLSNSGYGRFRINGEEYLSHRVSWIIHNGSIPKGLCICHKCDNPRCVNPKHLWLGTQKDNVHDMINKKRDIRISLKGEKNPWSLLKEKDIKKIKKMYKIGYLQKNIAKKFRVCQVNISTIVRGKSWKHVN